MRAPPPEFEQATLALLELRALARDRERKAHSQRHREQRRAAIGNERQRHALGGQHADRHAHIDEGLQADDDGKPRARELRERIARLAARSSRRMVRTQNSSAISAAEHEAELLARHREDEIGMRVGNAVFDRARAGTNAGKAAMLERLQRKTGLIAGIGGSRNCSMR